MLKILHKLIAHASFDTYGAKIGCPGKFWSA